MLAADEARLEWEATTKAVWYPKGKQPQIKVSREKKTKSFYGALNLKGGKEIVYMTDWQNSSETTIFLDKIREEYAGKRVLILWDGSPSHFGEVKDYLKGKSNLELMSFPPYSPELNPQEHVWREARNNVSHNHEVFDFNILVEEFYSYLMTHTFKSNFIPKYG